MTRIVRPLPSRRVQPVRAALMLLTASWLAVGAVHAQTDDEGLPYEANWISLARHEVPEWYMDAKFGIFIHWGVYSVPAFGSEWYPRQMYQEGTREFEHHVETYGPHRTFGYKDFVPLFRAEQYDPSAWASLFRRAGARFVVPVAEHHDGFAMYDSDLTTWDAADRGPRRDLIGELADAVREEGLLFGVSSHRAEHWFFFDGGLAFDSDVRDSANADFYGPPHPAPDDFHDFGAPGHPDEAFLNDWIARNKELVDRYQPQLFWFDWWINHDVFEPYLREFAAYYYNQAAAWDRGVAINYKHFAFPEEAAVLDVERGQFAELRPRFWQTDTAVSKNSWGYVSNQDYKTADTLVDDLVDIVSKNGALLLNIGPRPDGTIPEPEQQLLLEIGGWLERNGEAIYGTRPWRIFGEGPTAVVEGAFNDTRRQAFTGEDIRFTRKNDVLYAIALDWPGDTLTVEALGAAVRGALCSVVSVELLGSDESLEWSQDDDALRVRMPSERSGDFAHVFRMHLR